VRLVRYEQADGKGPVFVNPEAVASVKPHEWRNGRTLLTMQIRWADEGGCEHDTYNLVDDAETVASALNSAQEEPA